MRSRNGNAKKDINHFLTAIKSAILYFLHTHAHAHTRNMHAFALINDEKTVERVFPTLAFAGYLKDWGGPLPLERPVAYLVLMTEKTPDVNLAIDMGIAAQSILLTATEMGLGGCMIRSFKKAVFDSILKKDGYNSAFVIALGKPTERVYLTDVVDGDIKYFRDENDDHAVPKLSLKDLII